MRLFTASLATESNSFSPIPTNRASYEAAFYYPPGQHPDVPRHTTAPLYVARRRARQEGFELVEGSCFWAEPSGPTKQADYEEMRDEILGELSAAMPVDGVLLGLHGAMIAYGYDDPEGDLIERVRAIVGARVPIAVELDPHCHLTEKRVRLSDIMILYKEYPHTDFVERAEELVTLTLRTIRGEIKPAMSLYDCRMSDLFPTSREPGRSFADKLRTFEGKDGVLSVSLGHSYAQGDVPEHGTRVLVVTDDAKAKGDALARALGEEVRAKRGTWAPAYLGLDEAIDAAYAAPEGPTVVADPSDNAGGGAASDNTNVIRRLLERGLSDACVGPLWDPVAVQFCHAAGVGTTLPLRFGGKTAITSGAPVDAEVTIIGLKRDGRQSLRHLQGAVRGRGRHPGRRRRGLAHLAPDAGARARDLLGCRHRSRHQEVHRREVDEPLPRRLRPDRAPGALRRRRRPLAHGPAQVPLHEDPAPALAARRAARGTADHLSAVRSPAKNRRPRKKSLTL